MTPFKKYGCDLAITFTEQARLDALLAAAAAAGHIDFVASGVTQVYVQSINSVQHLAFDSGDVSRSASFSVD